MTLNKSFPRTAKRLTHFAYAIVRLFRKPRNSGDRRTATVIGNPLAILLFFCGSTWAGSAVLIVSIGDYIVLYGELDDCPEFPGILEARQVDDSRFLAFSGRRCGDHKPSRDRSDPNDPDWYRIAGTPSKSLQRAFESVT